MQPISCTYANPVDTSPISPSTLFSKYQSEAAKKYPKGMFVRCPFRASMKVQKIDIDFSQSKEGKSVLQAAEWFIKQRAYLTSTQEESVENFLVREAKQGTCRGEALVQLAVSRGPKQNRSEQELLIQSIMLQHSYVLSLEIEELILDHRAHIQDMPRGIALKKELESYVRAHTDHLQLNIVRKEMFEKEDIDGDAEFRRTTKAKLCKLAQRAQNIFLAFGWKEEGGRSLGHVVLLQPDRYALFDANIGEVQYSTVEDLIEDACTNMFREISANSFDNISEIRIDFQVTRKKTTFKRAFQAILGCCLRSNAS
jgi:hypothetical protein